MRSKRKRRLLVASQLDILFRRNRRRRWKNETKYVPNENCLLLNLICIYSLTHATHSRSKESFVRFHSLLLEFFFCTLNYQFSHSIDWMCPQSNLYSNKLMIYSHFLCVYEYRIDMCIYIVPGKMNPLITRNLWRFTWLTTKSLYTFSVDWFLLMLLNTRISCVSVFRFRCASCELNWVFFSVDASWVLNSKIECKPVSCDWNGQELNKSQIGNVDCDQFFFFSAQICRQPSQIHIC